MFTRDVLVDVSISFEQETDPLLLNFDLLCVGQKNSFLDPTKTYQHTRRQWILIGQKTIRTIEDKNIPSRGEEGFNLNLMNKLIKRHYSL